jgi:hypothetical protein
MAIGTTTALLGSAAIGGGTSLLGGIFGSRAARRAAEQQARAAQQVADSARQTAKDESANVANVANAAASGVMDVTGEAVEGVGRATGEANDVLGNIYRDQLATLDPYSEAGAEAIRTLRDLVNRDEKFKFSEDDPSFRFRMEQGQQALERSAAARGTLAGGGTLKALTRYGQEAASQEYQKAFDRFMAEKNQRLNTLSGLVRTGQDAANTRVAAGGEYAGRVSGNLTRGAETAGNINLTGATTAGQFRTRGAETAGGFRMQGEQIAGDAAMGGANARAAGTVGAANAWSGAAGGIGNAAMSLGQMLLLRDMTRARPAP